MDFEALSKQLESPDALHRDSAVQELAALGDFRAITVIAECLEQETVIQVIESMLEALRVLYEATPRVLVPLLSSDNPSIRNGIVRVLHESGENIIKILDELADHKNKDIRKFALDALKSKNTPASIAVLRKRLSDPDPNVQMTAIEYLGGLDDKQSAPKIVSILFGTDNSMTRFICLEALLKLNHPQATIDVINHYSELPEIPVFVESTYYKLLIQGGTPEHLQGLEKQIRVQKDAISDPLVEALIAICQRYEQCRPSETTMMILEAKKSQIDSSLVQQLDFLFSTPGGQSKLENARRAIRSDNPALIASGLDNIAALGRDKDIQLLENLADEQDDEDLIESISEAVSTINKRLQQN